MKQASLFLKAILSHNSTIVQKCGKRIFPIAAPAGVKDFPFVTFDHSSTPGNGTKDGTVRDIDAFVSIVSRTALEAEELSDSIIPSMVLFYETPQNEFADTFEFPEFVKEEELYVPEVEAYVVRLHLNFETK